jgi:hypothetical protein
MIDQERSPASGICNGIAGAQPLTVTGFGSELCHVGCIYLATARK